MKKIVMTGALLIGMFCLKAQDMSLYQKKIFIRGTDTLRYRILYPEHFNNGKAYPLLVFMHGSGERGSDNELQLAHGGDLFLTDSIRKNFRAIVIFPQCPAGMTWSAFPRMKRDTTAAFNESLNTGELTIPEKMVKLLMDSLSQKGEADTKRLYLGGLSLGGFGTYDLVIHYPNYFAAAFPICGQANIKLYVQKAAHLPLWIFHGALDNVVDPQPDRDLIKALQSKNIKTAQYTEYPQANHNSWDSTFAEPGLLPWLFAQHK